MISPTLAIGPYFATSNPNQVCRRCKLRLPDELFRLNRATGQRKFMQPCIACDRNDSLARLARARGEEVEDQ